MEMFLLSDLTTAFYGVVFGCLIGVVYDFFRVFRLLFHAGTIRLFLEDFIFSVLLAGSVFAFCFIFNSGKIRFFYLIAALLGWILYYFTAGRLIYRGIKTIFGKIRKLFGRRKQHQNTNI